MAPAPPPPSRRAPRRHRVVLVLVDGMNWFEPSVASEFFGIYRSQDVGVPGNWHTFCTERPGRVDLHGGPPVLVDDGLDALRRADTVVIPGWSTARDRPSPALVDALRRAHARGARLGRRSAPAPSCGAGRGRAAGRPVRHHALGPHRPVRGAVPPRPAGPVRALRGQRRRHHLRRLGRLDRSGPPPHPPRPRRRGGQPGRPRTWWSHRTATAARPSSSSSPWPAARRPTPSPRCSTGPWPTWTSPSTSRRWPPPW